MKVTGWPEYKMLDPKELDREARYQRGTNKKQVGYIAGDFDPVVFMAVLVARGKDGKLRVVEGKQRVTAAILAGVDKVPCLVFDSSGQKQEATKFEGVNGKGKRQALNPVDKYRAGLVAGEKMSRDIKEVVEDLGLLIAVGEGQKRNSPNGIGCIGTLEGVWREAGKEGVRKVLEVIGQAWPGDKEGRKNRLVGGISRVIQDKGPGLDLRALSRVLSRKPPQQWVLDAAGRSKGSVNIQGVSREVAEAYDRG